MDQPCHLCQDFLIGLIGIVKQENGAHALIAIPGEMVDRSSPEKECVIGYLGVQPGRDIQSPEELAWAGAQQAHLEHFAANRGKLLGEDIQQQRLSTARAPHEQAERALMVGQKMETRQGLVVGWTAMKRVRPAAAVKRRLAQAPVMVIHSRPSGSSYSWLPLVVKPATRVAGKLHAFVLIGRIGARLHPTLAVLQMSGRYFAESPIDAARVVLAGPQAHHLAHVMRARTGEEVTLFDGNGAEFVARIERIGRSQVELAVVSRVEVDREDRVQLTLGVALPKGDRQRWLIEKAVELGVARLVPVETTRGVAQPGEQAILRLRRAVIEASKQCGRNRLMAIGASASWTEFMAAKPHDGIGLVGQPGGRAASAVLNDMRRTNNAGPVLIAIGPEGGLTDQELAAAEDASWLQVDLGPRILRVETAAVLLAAMASLAGDGA